MELTVLKINSLQIFIEIYRNGNFYVFNNNSVKLLIEKSRQTQKYERLDAKQATKPHNKLLFQ